MYISNKDALKLYLIKRAYNYNISLILIRIKALKPIGYIVNKSL
jgi:hypothetical protein